MAELLPYQVRGAEFLAQRRAAMLLDAMRVGKTPTAIRASDHVEARTIHWQTKGRARWGHANDWRRFQKIDRPIVVLADGKDRPRHGAVNIVSYELASGALFQPLMDLMPDVAVFDEFHQFGTRDTRRTKAAFGDKVNGDGGLTQWPNRLWFLSGTPAPRDPSQLWPTLRCVFPDVIATSNGRPMDYWSFVSSYCVVKDNGFGKKIVGGKRLDVLRAKMAPHFLRRTFEEVNAELPRIRYADLPVDAGAYLKALETAELDALVREAGGSVEAIEKAGDKVNARIAQLTGLAKVQPLSDLLKDELDEGLQKVVIFAWHRDVIEAYAAALQDYGVVVMMGGSSSGEAAFNNDPAKRVFVGQIQAAGEAINLASADDIVFAEAFWTPGLVDQACYRCSQPGKANPVLVRFALADVGIDGAMMRTMRQRAEMMQQLFG